MTTPNQNLSPEPPYPQAKNTNGAKAWAALNNATQDVNVLPIAAIDASLSSVLMTSVTGGKWRASGGISGITAGGADDITATIEIATGPAGGPAGLFTPVATALLKASAAPFRFAWSADVLYTTPLALGATIVARIRVVNGAGAINTIAAGQAFINLQEFPG